MAASGGLFSAASIFAGSSGCCTGPAGCKPDRQKAVVSRLLQRGMSHRFHSCRCQGTLCCDSDPCQRRSLTHPLLTGPDRCGIFTLILFFWISARWHHTKWLPVAAATAANAKCGYAPKNAPALCPSQDQMDAAAKRAKREGGGPSDAKTLDEIEREEGGPVKESLVGMAQTKRALGRKKGKKGAQFTAIHTVCGFVLPPWHCLTETAAGIAVWHFGSQNILKPSVWGFAAQMSISRTRRIWRFWRTEKSRDLRRIWRAKRRLRRTKCPSSRST